MIRIEKLQAHITSALRQRGHSDTAIKAMSVEYAFDEFCMWHGLIDWGPQLRWTLANIQKASKKKPAKKP